MTGFGQVIDANIVVELKTLNSKFLDLSLRLPKKFSEKENEIRALVTDLLERGKVSLSIEVQQQKEEGAIKHYDENLFVSNYTELKKLADKVMAGYEDLFRLALDATDVKQNDAVEALDPAEGEKIISMIKKALELCNQFRDAEGKALAEKLKLYVTNIDQGLQHVKKIEPARTERIRAKLRENIAATFSNENADTNRLEQEMIYYIEKLDIQEECVRLTTHISYFLNVMNDKNSNGKKLAFIAQEMGREINTIGSKANDAAIQKHVVEMKDELEKIKEQLNNVL